MGNAELGLGVAVLIVLVLIYMCWKKSRKNNKGSVLFRKSQPRRGLEEYDTYEGMKSSKRKGNAEQVKEYKALANDVIGYSDWSEMTSAMSVEPEVFASHQSYVNDNTESAGTASWRSERDDPNDVVPWVGLRRPMYDVGSNSTSRVEESEDRRDMLNSATRTTHYVL